MKAAARVTQRALRALRVAAPSSHLLSIAPSKADGGKTLQWGGPQVGYSVPQFFMEVDVHSPSYAFRGAALPGASVLVPVGRGIDYAWSLTTGASDVMDTRVEKLCHPKGGTVRKGSKYYRFKGKCRRMAGRTETIQIKGSSPTDYTSTKYKVFRTVHGPVVARGKVKGRPVAITQQRSYWKKELNFVVAVSRINSKSMDSVQEFDAALALAPMSFNAVYSDSTDIGLWHVGHFPARAQGIDPRLPTWGTGKWEWKGIRPWATNPHVINPEQGWIANWNNKPSVGWDNADHSAWGPTQRVRLLSAQIEALLAAEGDTVGLAEVVNVMRAAATQDGNAVLLGGPRVLPQIAPEGVTQAAAATALAAWIEDGAHRQDRDRDRNQDHAAAVALWDTLYDNLVHNIFDDELDGSYDAIRIKIADDAPHSNGSAYFYDFSNLVWNLLDDTTATKLERNYCDDLATPATETCAAQVQKAFSDAVAELTAEQGANLLAWTWPADYIEFTAVGAPSVPPIPWQNRGTYNHAVEVTGTR
jgi:acyl-homoserine lactone acylase PvdQ